MCIFNFNRIHFGTHMCLILSCLRFFASPVSSPWHPWCVVEFPSELNFGTRYTNPNPTHSLGLIVLTDDFWFAFLGVVTCFSCLVSLSAAESHHCRCKWVLLMWDSSRPASVLCPFPQFWVFYPFIGGVIVFFVVIIVVGFVVRINLM